MPMFHDAQAVHLLDKDKSIVDVPNQSGPGKQRSSVIAEGTSTDGKTISSGILISPANEHGLRFRFQVMEYVPLLDSCNMSHPHWRRIAKHVQQYYDNFDGFVVLHGTDTMGYTGSALAFFLEHLAKPVVLTGSQIPICRQRNDGLMNLVGAMNVAAFHAIPEVALYFGSSLYRACRATKHDAYMHTFYEICLSSAGEACQNHRLGNSLY